MEVDARAAAPTVPIEASEAGPGGVLPAGTVLGERYRIERFIARGGMGAVYEARDLELEVAVALKFLRLDVAWSAAAVSRLKRETQLARAVTHPSVCRTFDLGVHRTADGVDLHFVTMELLAGETLADRLAARGRCDDREARAITRSIASALAAAHAALVVHRDLKPSNVMLIEQPGRPARVVVTDFGLARALDDAGPREPLDDGGDAPAAVTAVAGTPDYMAPEQFAGEEPSPATDVFALGIVIHELLTGTLPFGPADSMASARAQRATPRLRPLPAPWGAIVARALAEDPAARPTCAEIVDALAEAPRRRRGPTIAAAAGALAIAGVLVWRPWASRAPAIAAGGPRRAIAVLDWKCAAPDGAGPAFAEALADDLGRVAALRLIPRSAVGAALGAHLDGPPAAATGLARLGLGADLVIGGSCTARGDRLGFAIEAIDAATGAVVVRVAEQTAPDDVAAAAGRAADRIARGLRAGPAPRADRPAVPHAPAAARHYAAGLAAMRTGDVAAGVAELERATAAEPDFALAHAELSVGLLQLGYRARARAAAERALALASGLRRDQELLIEARVHEAAGEWARAAETYALLAGMAPDDPEYAMSRARALISAGDQAAAGEQLDALRAGGDSVRLALLDAALAGKRHDPAAVGAAARRAVAAADAIGADAMAARALTYLGQAQAAVGDHAAAERSFDDAERRCHAAGDRAGLAQATYQRASADQTFDPAAARAGFEQAVTQFRALGDRANEANSLNAIGVVISAEHLDLAQHFHDQALAIQREIGDRQGASITLLNLGGNSLRRGDVALAGEQWNQTLLEARALGDQNLIGVVSTDLAILSEQRADIAGQRLHADEAVAAFRAIGSPSLASALNSQGHIAFDQAQWADAQRAFEAAIAVPGVDATVAAIARLNLARIGYERGEHARSAADADALGDQLTAANELEMAIDARWIAARSWVGAGDLKRAEAAAADAERLVTHTEGADSQLGAALARAFVLTATRPRAAIALLERRRAQVGGLSPQELLVLGRAQLAAGLTAAGRKTLRDLERDTTQRGVLAIAGRAARLRDGSESLP